MIQRIKEIYEYRDMIIGLVQRDLRGRYKGSFLGFFWNFVNPLCQILVYYVVFSKVFRNGIENFHIYLMCGMFPWNFFSESLVQGSGAIVSQGDMTKKIYFPREVLPISTVTSRFINLLLTFVIIFGVILLSGTGINIIALLYLPIVLVIEYVITLGITLLLSALDVYYRDMEYIASVLMMAFIWMSPIMYEMEMSDDLIWKIIRINPMTVIIDAYHQILYYKQIPNMNSLGIIALGSISLVIVAEICFRKLEKKFAEEL